MPVSKKRKLLSTGMTPKLTDISAAIDTLCHQVWYSRHKTIPRHAFTDESWAKASALATKIEKEIADLGPWSDFEWGMLNGKLSALRWVLGDEWDRLDT